jgi:hypothetical protein
MIGVYLDASEEMKNKIRYFLLATAIGYVGGSLDYLPIFHIPLYPWGNFTIAIYPVIMSYAILQHRLMDITIVIRKTLVYSAISAVLASIYAGLVTLLARLIDGHPTLPFFSPMGVFAWLGHNLRIGFPYACEVTSVFSLGLGFFVFWKGRRRAIHMLWGLMCLSIALWLMGYGMLLNARSLLAAQWWMINIHYLGALFIPIFFFHFVTFVVGRRSWFFILMGYALALLCQVLSFSGILVGLWENTTYFRFYPKPISLWYLLFIGYFLLFRFCKCIVMERNAYVIRRSAKPDEMDFLGNVDWFLWRRNHFFYGLWSPCISIRHLCGSDLYCHCQLRDLPPSTDGYQCRHSEVLPGVKTLSRSS